MSDRPMKCYLFETDGIGAQTPITTLKVGLIGPNNAGKSEFIKYLIKGNQYRNFEIRGTCHIKGLRVNYDEEVAFILDVLEYTGPKQHQLQEVAKQTMDVYFLMYDVTSGDSFNQIKYQWLVDLFDMDILCFVIGNKADCNEETKVNTSVPGVSDMAWHAGHIELSCITGQQMDKLVQRTAEIKLNLQVRNRADDLNNLSISAGRLSIHEDNDIVQSYDMTGHLKGVCMIINNQEFDALSPRDGSGHDVSNIAQLFRSLGFQIQTHKNLKAQKMKKILMKTARNEELKQHKAFICFVLSHGVSGAVYGADGNKIRISEMTNIFTAKKCQFLFGKPKLFFIQACQGINQHESVQYEHDHVLEETERGFEAIPNEADFLVATSTVDGYVSYRDPDNGSIFINRLVECISNFRNINILDILTQVNDQVSSVDFPEKSKQMAIFKTTLRKRLTLM